jgi:hypothetical protein
MIYIFYCSLIKYTDTIKYTKNINKFILGVKKSIEIYKIIIHLQYVKAQLEIY